MTRCKRCGSTEMRPAVVKPPRKHNGPCTPECEQRGAICWVCKLFTPAKPN